jgi:chromosome segregation ATPase
VLKAQMPYLFDRRADAKAKSPNMQYAHPVGDAIIPGGASQSPDVEVLKKYLSLREQDVATLSNQLQLARSQIESLESDLQTERINFKELDLKQSELNRRLTQLSSEQGVATETYQAEINDLKFKLKVRADKAKILEINVREALEEKEKIKERVRQDIRKIRLRERELENRLEILKKDSESLISSRENKIIELKRKIDLMDFNMDLLQDQLSKEKESHQKLKDKIGKASQAMKLAGGFLQENKSFNDLSGDVSGDLSADDGETLVR